MSPHARKRMRQRGILFRQLLDALRFGRWVSQYKCEHPYPNGTCLVVGLHMVRGTTFIATVYVRDIENQVRITAERANRSFSYLTR